MTSKLMTKRGLCLLALFFLILGGCSVIAPPPPTPVPTPAPTLSADKVAELEEVFEIVWGTVNEMYFDPNFNGVDWQAMHDEYLPQVLTAEDEWSAYLLINEMCFELGVSHILILPPDMADELDPILSAPGALGLYVRILDNKVIITAVDDGSPADLAGLRPGFELLEVDGHKMENADELVVLQMPPWNERKARGLKIASISQLLYGEPGNVIDLIYRDDKGRRHAVAMEIAPRTEPFFTAEGFPTMYVGYEARRLEDGIAYIQLDGFLPPILEDVLAAIEEMRDAPGMIIDVRGNPGGFIEVRKAIASQFFEEPVLLWNYMIRPGLDLPGFQTVVYTEPPDSAYLEPLVVLVDVMSGSSSEEFSGTLSVLNRAAIVGTRTSGTDLVADVINLPNGAFFMYPIAQTQAIDGTAFEGRGVIPDIEIQLDQSSLLAGRDVQLEAAIEYLQSQIP